MRIPSRWTRSLWQHQVQKALLLAPENGVAQRLRSFSTQKHIHHHGVPRGSVDRRVQSLLSHSPLGSLDDTTIDFLQRSLQRICKQEVLSVEDIQTAEKRLKRIEEEVAGGNAKLTTSPYNRLLRAYARSNGNEEYLLKTTNLLGHMFSCDYLPNPDTYTYDAALYVCTRSNCASAAATAEQILHEMQSLAETDGTVAPTLTSYHNVILSHANQSASVYGAAAAAEDWLMKLSDLGCQPGNEHLLPTTQAFNHVLQAWAICAENNGADRALQILELMKKLDDSPSTPDAISFGTVINAYARRNRPEGAEVVLKQALDYFTARQERDVESTDGDAAIVDLTNCLNRTMGAWSKSSHADAAAHAKNLLDDAYTLSSFTTSQSRLVFAPDAATHYYYIVTLLKDDVHGVVQADHHLYSMIQSCLKSSALANRVVPTTGTFHTVMKAWARSKRPERAERATKLLHQMILLADARELDDCMPEIGTFNICTDVWYKSGRPEAAQEVLALLDIAESRNCVDAFTYQACVNVLCRARSKVSTLQAVDVLKRYEWQAGNRKVVWDPKQAIGLYTAVIRELGELRDADAANLALDLFRGIRKSGPRAARPSTSTYTALMMCFARLGTKEAARVVLDVFREIRKLDRYTTSKVRLDPLVFKVVLGSLARVHDYQAFDEVLSFLIDQIVSGRPGLLVPEFLKECKEMLPRCGLTEGRSIAIERQIDDLLTGAYRTE